MNERFQIVVECKKVTFEKEREKISHIPRTRYKFQVKIIRASFQGVAILFLEEFLLENW